MVRAEGGSLRFWGPGLLSTSPAFSMSSASHSAGSSGWLAQKRELGPLSSGQGKLMPFVDPDRIEQSDRVQAASFAPDKWSQHSHWMLVWVHSILDPKHPLSCADPDSYFILQMVHHRYQPKEEGYCGYLT